jgi:hypothetical protein
MSFIKLAACSILCILQAALQAQVLFVKHAVDDNFQGACSVCTADINHDGLPDILGAASESNELAWWENDGSSPPLFTKHLIDDDFTVAIYISAGDVDGDGDMDVLGAAWGGNQVALWLNSGGSPVSWSKVVIDDGFTQAHEVKAANIDGTGGIDIVAASAGKNEVAWWQNGGGNPIVWNKFSLPEPVYGARSVYPVDIDKDGDVDIACAAFTSNEVLLFVNGGGNPVQWTKQTISGNFNGSHWVHACDMDNDNDMDLLGASCLPGSIAIWYNQGGNPSQWEQYNLGPGLPGALSVVTGDLDKNGFADVVAAGVNAGDVRIWYNQGGSPPSFVMYTLEPNFPGVWPVHVCDLENDSDTDILSASSTLNDICWWENQATSTQEEEISWQVNATGLSGIAPNPFSDKAEIRYFTEAGSQVTLRIYSIVGKLIRTMSAGEGGLHTGCIVWDGQDDAGYPATKGMYLCILTANGVTAGRQILIKL